MAGMGPAVLPADDNNDPIISASDANHAAEDVVSPNDEDGEVFSNQPLDSQGENDGQENRVEGVLPVGAQTPLEDELADEVQDMV